MEDREQDLAPRAGPVSPVMWYWILAALLVLGLGLAHRATIFTFDTSLHWSAWVVGGLVLVSGGWMAFDGGRALLLGDYVTPQSGRFAGALGPWARVVEALGIEPRSVLMRSTLLVYGAAFMTTTAAFLSGITAARWGVVLLAAMGLWYIPFGTLLNLVIMILMLLPPLRGPGSS